MTKPPTAPLPWSPDQPLRADATDEQIRERELHLLVCELPSGPAQSRLAYAAATLAREFAAACVEDARRASPAAPGWRESDAVRLLRGAFCERYSPMGMSSAKIALMDEFRQKLDALFDAVAAASPVSGSAPHPDTVRLDWLERDHNALVFPAKQGNDFGVRVQSQYGTGFSADGKLRAAIDAARGTI